MGEGSPRAYESPSVAMAATAAMQGTWYEAAER